MPMTDLLIIGAGPAGLAAAIASAEQGIAVTVIDEFVKPGGRLLGQLHQEPSGQWWNGIEQAERQYDRAKSLGIDIRCGVSVYNLERLTPGGWRVSTTAEAIDADNVLLATGAAETACPIPGWTLPGVMSIGAAQVMTNVQRVRVGKRGVIIGINILSVAIMRELQLAGIELDRMVLPAKNPVTLDAGDPQQIMDAMLRVAHLAPSALLRFGSGLLKNPFMRSLGLRFYPASGVKMWGVPIQLRMAAVEIFGRDQVEGVRLTQVSPTGEPIAGTEHDVACDFACIAGGLYPLAELAAVAGCPFAYVPELGGHVPIHNERMQTPLAGLYVAGNITGIESAKVAIAQGTVAGLSVAADLGRLTASTETSLLQAIRHVEQTRSQATIQFHPLIGQGRRKMAALYEQQITS